MFKELRSVISFLTIIPVGSANLETIAKYMYLFPLVGLAIGGLVGFMGYGLSDFGLDSILIALLVVASIFLITGIHHTDGLADFADGLMANGTKEKKIAVMKDVNVGSAGIVSIVLYSIGMIISLSLVNGLELFRILILAEIIAKFSMVLMAYVGTSASNGSNTLFLQQMKDKKKFVISFSLTVILIWIMGNTIGLILFCGGIAVSLFLVLLSNRSFGGITGDVLGASNELTRLTCVLIFVSV